MRAAVPWATLAALAAGCVRPAPLACDLDVDCPDDLACRANICEPVDDAQPSPGERPDVKITDAGTFADDAGEADAGSDGGDADAGVEVDGGPAGDWWDLAWQHRVRISLASGPEAFADFPLLVTLDAAALDLAAAAVDGRDVRFVDADGVTELPYEVEAWQPDAQSSLWVRVPLLEQAPADDFIWLYFGNPQASSAEDGAAVWSAGYAGVWHLNGDVTPGGQRDSSAHENHGTALGASPQPGVVAGGLAFNGNDVVRIDGSAQGALNVLGPLTLSAWVFATDASGGAILARREGSTAQWQLQVERFGSSQLPQPSLIWSDDAGVACIWATSAGLPLSQWHHLAVVIDADGAPLAFLMDGIAVPFSPQSTCSGAPLARAIDVAIGARWAGVPSTGFSFGGAIDEARVETEARSVTWLAAQHASMTNALATFGTVESVSD